MVNAVVLSAPSVPPPVCNPAPVQVRCPGRRRRTNRFSRWVHVAQTGSRKAFRHRRRRCPDDGRRPAGCAAGRRGAHRRAHGDRRARIHHRSRRSSRRTRAAGQVYQDRAAHRRAEICQDAAAHHSRTRAAPAPDRRAHDRVPALYRRARHGDERARGRGPGLFRSRGMPPDPAGRLCACAAAPAPAGRRRRRCPHRDRRRPGRPWRRFRRWFRRGLLRRVLRRRRWRFVLG